MAIETPGREFEAAVAHTMAVKMQVIGSLARMYRQSDPFATDEGRVAVRKANAAPPPSCGPEIIAAPARGAMVAFAPVAVTPKGASDYEVSHIGYRGRDAARAADAFDVMEAQARRRGGASYHPLFTVRQVMAGRRYAELVERHSAVGMRCASVEALAAGASGGSGDGGYLDAVISEGREIARMEALIGTDAALMPRRGGGQRRAIGLLDLVQMVCLRGLTLSQVLKARGWAVNAYTRGTLHGALLGALDRIG